MGARLALAMLLALPASALGYPIPPRTVVRQLRDAELVVVAKVVSVADRQPTDEVDLDDAVATLEVVETWKGQAVRTLEVPFASHLICPAPPRYLPGRTVLAFLVREKQGGWSTLGLSYGTLYPEKGELEALRESARAWGALREGDAGALTELLVQLASRRATRWDALFELVPEGDEMHDYYRRKQPPQGDASRLTEKQLARIAAGFVAEPSGDQTLAMTLLLLSGYPDRAFDRTVAGVLDAMLARDEVPWWFSQAFELAMARFVPARRAQAGKGSPLEKPGGSDPKKVWERTRPKLDLGGPIPRIDLPSFGMPGVGRRTPS